MALHDQNVHLVPFNYRIGDLAVAHQRGDGVQLSAQMQLGRKIQFLTLGGAPGRGKAEMLHHIVERCAGAQLVDSFGGIHRACAVVWSAFW